MFPKTWASIKLALQNVIVVFRNLKNVKVLSSTELRKAGELRKEREHRSKVGKRETMEEGQDVPDDMGFRVYKDKLVPGDADAQDDDEVETPRERWERKYTQKLLKFLPSCMLECLSKQKTEGEEQDVPDDMEAEE